IVRSIGRRQGRADIDEHGGAPGRRARLDIALAVTHHEALLEVNAKFHGRLEDHAWLWLAAVAVLAMPVEAGLDGIEGQFTRHDLVHRVDFRVGDQAVSHVRLVGDYRQEKTRLLSFWRLAAASGYSLKSSSRLGAKLRPSRNSGTTITPSRSRNTAGLNPWARLTISSAYAARLDG